MQDAAFVLGGWAVVLGSITAYAVHLLRRGRALSRQVPEDHRRWT